MSNLPQPPFKFTPEMFSSIVCYDSNSPQMAAALANKALQTEMAKLENHNKQLRTGFVKREYEIDGLRTKLRTTESELERYKNKYAAADYVVEGLHDKLNAALGLLDKLEETIDFYADGNNLMYEEHINRGKHLLAHEGIDANAIEAKALINAFKSGKGVGV